MLKRRVIFFFVSQILPGPIVRIGMILGLLSVVALLSGSIALFIENNEFPSPGAATWWAILRISDPGYLADDDSSGRLALLSGLLSLTGSAFLAGGVAAVMTQWLTAKLSALAEGTSIVPFQNHVVVVGWCDRTPHIIEQLLVDDPGARIVVLSELLPEDVRAALSVSLTEVQVRRVVPRSGSPRRAKELSRAALTRAAHIILPVLNPSEDGSNNDSAKRLREIAAVRACLDDNDDKLVSETSKISIVVELADRQLTDFARALLPQAQYIQGDRIVADALISVLAKEPAPQMSPLKTLLIGSSSAQIEVVEALHALQTPREVSILVGDSKADPTPKAQAALDSLGKGAVISLRLHRTQLDHLTAESPSLDLSGYDEFVILAERGAISHTIADDRSLAFSLLLATMTPKLRQNARIVIELLDEDSERLIVKSQLTSCMTSRVVGKALGTRSTC